MRFLMRRDRDAYTIQWRCGLTGALDSAALRGGAGRLWWQRHESLRTIFHTRT